MVLRVVFMGSPVFAVPTLSEIIGAEHNVVAVYAQPPRPAGRGQTERLQPVHQFALNAGIPVFTPQNLRGPEIVVQMRAHDADVAVVVAYGVILPQAILDIPRYGCLNLHGSLLPHWRGAAPIQRAVMAGDTETGVMVMRMEAGLDTGPVGLAEHFPIDANVTTGDVHVALSTLGAGIMVRALAALERGSLTFTPQRHEGVTYARKIEKAESRIDFALPATEVHNHIRGLSPFPGAWFEIGTSKGCERIKVLRSLVVEAAGKPGTVIDDALTVACATGALRIVEVQRAGKKPMSAADMLRGFDVPPGTELNPAD